MTKRSTKVPLIPGTNHPEPEITGGWVDDNPCPSPAGSPITLLVVRGLNDPDAELRREVRHGTAFDLFTTLGAEHERKKMQAGNEKRRAEAQTRDLARAAERHRQGEPWKVIASELGLHPDTLRKQVKAAKLPAKKKRVGS